MQVEVLSDFRHEDHVFVKGEVRIVEDQVGEYFCRAGWVKDVSGVVPTATPALGETILLHVDNISQVDNVQAINSGVA